MHYELRYLSGLVERWGENEVPALTDAHEGAILRGAQFVRVEATGMVTVICDVEDDAETDVATAALVQFIAGQ